MNDMTDTPSKVECSSSLVQDTDKYLAIEIGGSKLQVAVGDASGRLQRRLRFDVNREAGAQGILAQLKSAFHDLLEDGGIKAVGAGFGGPIDWRTGRIVCSHHLSGWNEFPLAEWLTEQTGLPAFVENDANAAALGEALFGAGRGADPVLWMNAGSGVGGGLVAGGRLYHGAVPGEMELGHLRLNREGTITEDLCSGWAVDRMVRAEVEAHAEGAIARAVRAGGWTSGEARALAPALESGDAAAGRLLDEVAESMAYALSHAVHLLHPAVIVLGGGVALLGEALRARVAAALSSFLMTAFQPGPSVRLAELMEDAVLVGSLAVVRQNLSKH